VYCNRAISLLKVNKFAEAESDCTKAIVLDYTSWKAYVRRGIARREQKNYKGSLEDLEKAVALVPDNKDAKKELEITRELCKPKVTVIEDQKPAAAATSPASPADSKRKKVAIQTVEEDDGVEEMVTPSASVSTSLKKAIEKYDN